MMADAFTERKRVVAVTSVLGMILSAGALAAGKTDGALGMMWGALVGIADYYLRFRHLASLQSRDARVGTHAAKFFLRYLFLGLTFFLAFKLPPLNFWAFLLGFLLIHLAIGAFLILKFFRRPA